MSEPTPESAPAAGRSKIFAAFLLPLFFVVVFPLMFVSATHNPTPYELPIMVAGPDQVVAQIADGLESGDQFSVTQSDVPGDAQHSVEHRVVDGAIDVAVGQDPSNPSAANVTVYVAGGEGRAVAATVQAAGEGVAAQLGTTATVVDVAPLAAPDPLGVNLFYLLTFSSLGAYLVIIVLMQVMPKASLRTRFIAVTITSIAAPSIVFGLSSIFVGDYGASFGTIAALLGVNALYVFTVGTAAILIEQLMGKAATFGVMAFIVFLNFPSAGGATPGAMLPPFWQAIHSVYFGSGAFESFRSIIYFDGNGASRWLLQLIAWTVGLILVNFIVYLGKTVRAQRRTISDLTAARDGAGAAQDHRAGDGGGASPDADEGTAPVQGKRAALEYDRPDAPPFDTRRRSLSLGEGAHL